MKQLAARSVGLCLIAAACTCLNGCGQAETLSHAAVAADAAADEKRMQTANVETLAFSYRENASEDGADADAAGQDITFDTIKFEMEKGTEFKRSMLTEAIEDLMGDKVRIRGYMYPTFKKSGIKRFVLVRDNQECCFGPGAALFDCIVVEMAGEASTSYTTRPVTVEGVFGFDEMKDPFTKETRAIYHLEGIGVE